MDLHISVSDAILRGGDYCGGPNVTQEYYDEMHAYIERMKREKAMAKQNNQIEEKDADTSEKEDGSGRFAAPVKPFRHIALKMLPKKKRCHFNDCCAILDYMENAVKTDESVASLSEDPSAEIINEAYERSCQTCFETRAPISLFKGRTWLMESGYME